MDAYSHTHGPAVTGDAGPYSPPKNDEAPPADERGTGPEGKHTMHADDTAPYDPWRAPADFAAAIGAAGLGHPQIIADGTLHRYHVDGDRPGTRNGWYVLHLDGTPAGAFGTWKGETHTWSARSDRALSPRQQADIRRLVEQARAARDAEARDRHARAAERAAVTWQHATSADPGHPYLMKKAIRPHGIRQQGIALVIPVLVSGAVASIQTIYPDGSKRFLPGGRIAGGYDLIADETRRPEVLIAEGFATAATLHEETGAAVYVAFNAGNLLPVARYVRALHPRESIILCADADRWTDGNPGVTKATAAAIAVGGKLLVPDFTGLDLSGRPTDFNDLYRLRRAAAQQVAA